MKGLESAGLESDQMFAMDRAQEKERKREAKKDLKFYDQQDEGVFEPIKKCFYIESAEITSMSS